MLEKLRLQFTPTCIMNPSLYYFLLPFFVVSTSSENILGIFPAPGYSQFILGEKLMTELVRRGHHVTVISPYKPREDLPNYRTVLTDGLVKGPQRDLFPRETEGFLSRIKSVHQLGYKLTEYTLSHPEVQKLIHSNETFDLVIVEQFVNEALMGFGPHFGCPTILFSSIGLSEWNSHLMGDLRLPSIVPVSKTDYTGRMSFFQRLINSGANLGDILYKEFVAFPQQQEYLDKYFPKKMNLKEIIYNASLMLLNSHVVTTQPTSLTSAVIEIGGFHISPKKLPADLEQYLDKAEKGAILFSMGTNLNISNLSVEKLNSILKALGRMEQKILWKMEKTDIPNIPDNVLISQWLPQSDILGHPNVVAFITHGGLLSVTEAIHYGVPMVGAPIFGDQRMNIARCVQNGIAVHLPLRQISEESLLGAVNEVVQNPKYLKNSKRLANIFRDQVVNPLDLAMYWVEFVMRHNGATHLRNASLDLYWYQLYLIDVLVFLVLCVVVCYLFIKYTLGNKGKSIVREGSRTKHKPKRHYD